MRYNPDSDCRLHVNINDGRLQYLREGGGGPPWRQVPKDQMESALNREKSRLAFFNAFMGRYPGKTLIVFGLGPQTQRFTPDLISYLIERDDIRMATVNGGPAYCRTAWGHDPSNVFDFVVGADRVVDAVHHAWGWYDMGGRPRFCKVPEYTTGWVPLQSAGDPSIACYKSVYYHDSVTAVLTLGLVAMATETRVKDIAGPNAEWPERRMMRADGGRIILVGVEGNSLNHCYTGDDRFKDYPDHPDKEWQGMPWRKEGHQRLADHARDLGAKIYQSAPWSMIDENEFCDFEDILDISAPLRVGITSKGQPTLTGETRRAYVVTCGPGDQLEARIPHATTESVEVR